MLLISGKKRSKLETADPASFVLAQVGGKSPMYSTVLKSCALKL